MQDQRQQGAESVRAQAKVDEAGPGGLGRRDLGTRGQVLDEGGGDLGGRLACGLGRDHGGVGRHVAVGRVARGRDLDACGDVRRKIGNDLGQSGKDGLAQASVEVGRVHGGVLARNKGLGRWLVRKVVWKVRLRTAHRF